MAWGGTAAQAGRLTGLLILSLELKKFVGRGEIYAFWTSLFLLFGKHAENYRPARVYILSGSVVANNAFAVGTLR